MIEQFTKPLFATRDARGVQEAKLLSFKLHHPKKKQTSAQRAGIRYEKKALKHLSLTLEGKLLYHPAFKFRQGAYDEYAIPDAIYFHDRVITIFEIKLKHTADAWHQLNRLYGPVLSAAYPGYTLNLCEVCRDFDPQVTLGSRNEIVDDVDSWVKEVQNCFGIYLFSGRI